MTKILVTGATGFVGNHVVAWLLKNNCEVIATATSAANAKLFPWYSQVKFIPCDYFHEEHDFYDYFEKPEIIIHLAWKGLPNYMDQIHMQNLYASHKLLADFIKHKSTKIVVIGTDKEYGVVNGCLSEDMITNPNTVYGLAKDTLRKNVEMMSGQEGFNWNWIRLFFVYGPGQNPKSLLPQLDAAIERGDKEFPMSGGEQIRDYLYVERAAEYICKIALQRNMNGVVNCCSGEMISVRRLVENRIKERGSPIELKLGVYGYSTFEGMAFWGETTSLLQIISSSDKKVI